MEATEKPLDLIISSNQKPNGTSGKVHREPSSEEPAETSFLVRYNRFRF